MKKYTKDEHIKNIQTKSNYIMETNNIPSEHYVAFLDILGYSERVKNSNNEESNNFYKGLTHMMRVIKSEYFKKRISKTLYTTTKYNDEFDFKVKLFSDNILISVKCANKNIDKNADEKNLYFYTKFLKLIMTLQFEFPEVVSVNLRGGVYKGLFIDDDIIVYGKALVYAVELEHKAKYPRVILNTKDVDDIILDINKLKNKTEKENLLKEIKYYILKDEDCYFLNIFNACAFNLDTEEVLNKKPKETPKYIYSLDDFKNYKQSEILKDIKKKEVILGDLSQIFKKQMFQITEAINKYCYYEYEINNDEYKKIGSIGKIVEKYIWLIDYFNIAVKICRDEVSHLYIHYNIETRKNEYGDEVPVKIIIIYDEENEKQDKEVK